ncbi:glycosyltransferase [Patescibacteria group bacterium]|nr:glycosyltransferase [Patescibacteria group bacterium]
MKKLIYIANVRIPTEKAHGIQIMKMCQAFAVAGHDLTLVVPRRKNEIKKSIWEYYDQEKNFGIEYLKITDFMKIVIPRISFYLQSRSFLKSVLFYLKNKNLDIIYSRDLSIVKYLDFENVFYEMHSLPRSFNKNDLEKVKGVITITKGLKNALIKKGIPEDRILVAPDGVDIENFDIDISKEEVRKKLDLPLNKKIVLYTGHLYEWKGAQILADASEFLDENMIVIFVGGTEKDVKEFRNRNRNKNNILILGDKPYSGIPYYLKAADVLVLPNSGKTEISKNWTSPMKMFEYMASKKPIIASDLPSMREILNENNAILVESDNSQSLAQGIRQALKNQDFSSKISSQAYQDVQKYTWQKRVNNILKFIK